MNKKQETAIGIAVAAILVGYFVYQVAYGSNESAYRFGYNMGKEQWKSCIVPESSCALGQDSCTGTWDNAAKVVTNQTACIDGFINGWNKVCTHSLENTDGNSKAVCPDYKVNEGLPYNY